MVSAIVTRGRQINRIWKGCSSFHFQNLNLSLKNELQQKNAIVLTNVVTRIQYQDSMGGVFN